MGPPVVDVFESGAVRLGPKRHMLCSSQTMLELPDRVMPISKRRWPTCAARTRLSISGGSSRSGIAAMVTSTAGDYHRSHNAQMEPRDL